MKSPFLASSALVIAGLALAPAFSTPDPTDAAALLGSPEAATTWTVDPVHSSVGFRIRHLDTAFFHGRFNVMSGTVVFDAEKPAETTIEFEVDAASVDTANKDRDEHLRGPDFFNAKVNPKIRFQSSKVTPDGKNKFQVVGTLSLHGVDQEITLTAEFTGAGKNNQGREVAGFEATFTIQRSAFGITTYPGALGEEVRIHVAIEALKKA